MKYKIQLTKHRHHTNAYDTYILTQTHAFKAHSWTAGVSLRSSVTGPSAVTLLPQTSPGFSYRFLLFRNTHKWARCFKSSLAGGNPYRRNGQTRNSEATVIQQRVKRSNSPSRTPKHQLLLCSAPFQVFYPQTLKQQDCTTADTGPANNPGTLTVT